jgi:neutral ceramidase
MAAAEYNRVRLKKLLTALLVLVVLAALAFGVGSMRWRPSRRAAPPHLLDVRKGAGALLAGAAVVPLDPPAPVPVAGFPRLHWMEEGRRDPVAVRALVVQETGCTVAFVSTEILLVPDRLQRAVERKVRDLGLDGLVMAATHTHAGPGAYWDEPLGERLATGPYREDVFDHLVDRTAEALRSAAAALQPAYLSVGRGVVAALARNRGGDEVDGRLVSARLVGLSGAPVAEVVVYPSHATLLGIENRLISGDWPGALMRGRPGPVLFFQGALGDQSPRMPPRTAANPEVYAQALAARIDALTYSRPDPWPELALARATAVLPAPVPGATPPLLRRIAMNLFYDWVPARARVAAVRLGPVTFIAVPAEPVAAVGRSWREAAGSGSEILALAGDYLGYVETSERMAEAAGETVRTYYGPQLAERLAGAIKLAAEAVGQNRTAGAPRASNDR